MHPKRKPVFSKKQYQRVHFVSFLHSFEGYLETLFTVSWRSNQGYVVIGSCGNDDWAVSRAADCTLETMTMVVRVAETLKGPSAEPPTTP